ncbi:MAG: RNase adapter RapZ [Lachnospiraceae bacterium]|nr:RNase adapter RapZ [Lachnospiraceae bacterium]
MRFVIVTGMSGAGKSSVLNMLEDAGYFCADNLPVPLISKFAQIAETSNKGEFNKIAIGVDIRSGHSLDDVEPALTELKEMRIKYEILFLEASDEVLIKRFKETRRSHPLAGSGRVEAGLEEERKKIAFLKGKADYVLDTSTLLVRDLKKQIDSIFVQNEGFRNFIVTVLSFGFKYGIPRDADMVFDVRFLANPYYVHSLKALTGEDKGVHDFVMNDPKSGEFLAKLVDMIEFLIPNYINEGKNGLVIAVGCTGGKHRSVTIANELTKALIDAKYSVKVDHRDITR